MMRTILSSLVGAAILSTSTSPAASEHISLNFEKVKVPYKGSGTGANAKENSMAAPARRTNTLAGPNKLQRGENPTSAQDDRYGGVKVQFHWEREK